MDEAARSECACVANRSGLANNEFELYYQQQNDTRSGSIVGFEALLALEASGRGMISPVEFIPIAEQTGFIVELGEWVLREAARRLRGGKNRSTIAVTWAPQQLADNEFPTRSRKSLPRPGLRRNGWSSKSRRQHHCRPSPRPCYHSQAQVARCQDRMWILWYGLLLTSNPAKLPVRQDQDRPRLHRWSLDQCAVRSDRSLDAHSGA